MGNQIPSQIYPVENYLADLRNTLLPNATFEVSLGSTRFLKVMKCHTEEGSLVVKVFVINDTSLPLQIYKKQLVDVALKLTRDSPNCLQYQLVELTERAGFMIRQFIKNSLYDRISTRPFLTMIEKKWLAYQLLCALRQAHQENVCHGDIKLENILVTSWTWLVLADFTPVKPALLPENNPADYTYFFDTSRRRTCYIAPERFFKSTDVENFEKEFKEISTDLNPPMDIFSAGCALAELFTEGTAPFDLTQLLAYRVGGYSPDKVLDKIEDQGIKELISNMIQKDPNKRLSAHEYLKREKGKTFPENFYSFFWPFFKQFATTPLIPPDERIKRIKMSLDNILQQVGAPCTDENGEKKDEEKSADICEGLILISTIITSSIRSLLFSSSKCSALVLLAKISKYLPDDIILDRILPYIFEILKDPDPRVREECIRSLTSCLAVVRSVPKTDVNIFPEYILPNLNNITQDESVMVRSTYAECIATIADTALRFLEYSYTEGLVTPYDYESEYTTLQETFHQKVAALFSDPANIVKRTLMETSVTRLCIFFGKQKANDVLLSHMITFLNDKKDHHLRLSFFTSVVSVAAYIGHHCADILKPLLLQGLSDSEEFVVSASIESMIYLTEIGLFPDYMMCELVAGVAPLLIHPNLWIVHAVVGLVSTVSKLLPLALVLTSIMKHVKPFLVKDWVSLTEEVSILASLRPAISRDVYEALLKSPVINDVLLVIRDARDNKISLTQLAASPALKPQSTKNVLRRLVAAGFSEDNLDPLFLIKDHLVRTQMSRNVIGQGKSNMSPTNVPGLLTVSSLKINSGTIDLLDLSTLALSQHDITNSPVNSEWHTMTSGNSSHERVVSPKYSDNRSGSPSDMDTNMLLLSTASTLLPETSTKNMMVCRAECKEELSSLVKKKKEEFLTCSKKKKSVESLSQSRYQIPTSWKPKGILLAHIHEHKGAINQLISLGDQQSMFASCSNDGTTMLWDCNKTERVFPVNRAKAIYNRQGGKILSLAACYANDSIAASSDNGSIHVIKSDKMALLSSRQLDKEEDGFVMDMDYYDSGSQSMLIYATVYGSIVGWDLRKPGTAFKLENGANKGVLSSIACEPGQNWLAAGTSNGYLVCWDLRFLMAISSQRHLTGAAVKSLKIHPTHSSSVIASHSSSVMSSHSRNNEISIYDLETRCCNTNIWTSFNPSKSTTNSHQSSSVYGMHVGIVDRSPFILSGGIDRRIRCWNLQNPEKSYIVCHAAHDHQTNSVFNYSTQVIDGTKAIEETFELKPPYSGSEETFAKNLPPLGHKDTITDIILINKPQNIMVSAAYDGTMKMWK